MRPATFLGFDYGRKRIGVAVGNSVSRSSTAIDTVRVINSRPDWQHIGKLIEQWQPDALVVGLPLNMDGSENEITPEARRFGNRLHGRYGLPVHRVDERLTTKAALSELRQAGYNKQRSMQQVDSHAARHILQSFLDQIEPE